MKGLNWKGIALGVVVNWCLMFVLGLLLLVIVAVVKAAQGALLDNLVEQMFDSILVLWFLLFTSSLATYAGAYVATARSESLEVALQNAAIFVALLFFLGFILENARPESDPDLQFPLWHIVTSYALNLPAAYFGAIMRVRRNLKTNRVLNSSTPPIAPIPLP